MDTVRYYFAFSLLCGLPYVIIGWLIIHSLARFWRRIGGYYAWILVWVVLAGIIITINVREYEL